MNVDIRRTCGESVSGKALAAGIRGKPAASALPLTFGEYLLGDHRNSLAAKEKASEPSKRTLV